MTHFEQGWISPNQVFYNLVNLRQICFEVTDACNLACKYCVYREFYLDHDERHGIKMSFPVGKNLIDYLCQIWHNNPTGRQKNVTRIGFYGGEPLLNMSFIQQMVDYVKSLRIDREFDFGMTTNGVLLDKHMDFLAKNDFQLVISLDGDSEGDAYRITKKGESSFGTVFSNCKKLMLKYPSYFNKSVSFNSVLHSKNSVGSIRDFIQKEFNKNPMISEVNPRGLNPAKKDDFMALYKNKMESVLQEKESIALEEEMFMENPRTLSLYHQLVKNSGNFFGDYLDLFRGDNTEETYKPCDGTCSPFSRKLFLAVSGKVFQCERCGQSFPLGKVDEKQVELDVQVVAEKVNSLLSKADRICSKCADRQTCYTCLYSLIGLDGEKPRCLDFSSPESVMRWKNANREFLAENPLLYERFVKTLHVK